MMERRKFVKSLLPLVVMFSNAFGSHAVPYKGKRLLVSDSDKLQAMFKKRDFSLPKFNSDKSIMDEMRRFVDMSEGHMDEIGNEVYGCEHGDGSYSMTTETQMAQTVTLTFADGTEAAFTGPAVLFKGTKKVTGISFGDPFKMSEGFIWGKLESGETSPDSALGSRTVSKPGAVLNVKAVPIPPKIQSKMAEAIRGEK